MAKLFEEFPNLQNEKIIIRKMVEEDIDSLMEITNNDNVYKYISPFLYKKSRKQISTAIKNIGERDFDKKKWIIAGVYLKDNPNVLIGLAEMFEYKKRANKITIGYRINESYWNQGIATNIIKLMVDYLCNEVEVKCLEACVMPANIYSSKALLRNGFKKEEHLEQKENWGSRDVANVEVYTYERNLDME